MEKIKQAIKSAGVRPIATYLLAVWALVLGFKFITGFFTGKIYPMWRPDLLKNTVAVPGSYSPELDIVVDWGILVALGVIVFSYGMVDLCRWMRKLEKNEPEN